MPETTLVSRGNHIAKTALPWSLILSLVILLTLPAWGGDKEKDEETLKNATSVLQEMLNAKEVPSDLIGKADCVMVLPSVKKFGVGIGGSGGRGPMSCRTGKNFKGKWSAPAMFTVSGVSAGLQVGGSSTDFVLLFMADKAVEAVLKGKTKLGRDATAAAGPSGATTGGAAGGSDILTYGRAKGLFAGVSMGGATLEGDKDANDRLYGKGVDARDIVTSGTIKATAAGEPLVSLLNSKTAKHGR